MVCQVGFRYHHTLSIKLVQKVFEALIRLYPILTYYVYIYYIGAHLWCVCH